MAKTEPAELNPHPWSPAGTAGRSARVASIRWRANGLALLGDLAVLVATYTYFSARFSLRAPDPLHLPAYGWGIALAIVWLPFAFEYGAYRRSFIVRPFRSAYTTAKATAIAGAVFHLLPFAGGRVDSRFAILASILAVMLTLTGWRVVLAWVTPAGGLRRDLVIVGAGWAGRVLAHALAGRRGDEVRLLAFVDTDKRLIGKRVEDAPVFSIEHLAKIAESAARPVRIVLAMPDEAQAAVYEELTAMAQAGVEITPMASVYEEITGRIPIHHLGNHWWASLPRPSGDVFYLVTKRAVDIALALAGLVLLAITFVPVAVALRRETGGSLFLSQVRVGLHGKPFRVIKLRTLPVSNQEFSSFWDRKNGNKPSRVGAFLRSTGIDELPQCINVLRGEMSIVGPRPYVPEEVDDYQIRIPFFRCRSLVKPGITGWAQTNWGYGHSLDDEEEKLQYDLYYVGHQCMYLDLLIVGRTLGLVLRRRRAGEAARAAVVG